jgi:tetratricopeptide (TPR) repeat protein
VLVPGHPAFHFSSMSAHALLRARGEALRTRGEYQAALPALRESLEIAERDGTLNALEIAASLNALALLDKDLGRFDEARRRYDRALRLVLRSPPSAARTGALASLYHNLGGIEHARGRLEIAEPLARTGVTLRAADAGPAELAADLVALAAIVDERGRSDEAEALYAQALHTLRATEPPDDLAIAVALGGLGALHARQGRLADAGEALEQSRRLKRRALSSRHPDLVFTLHNHAVVDERLGNASRAMSRLNEALAICSTLGPDHPRTIACRRLLARLASHRETRASRPRAHDASLPRPFPSRRRIVMTDTNRESIVRIDLTPEQKRQVQAVTKHDADAIELTVHELEQRIAPRLATNHNESLLDV